MGMSPTSFKGDLFASSDHTFAKQKFPNKDSMIIDGKPVVYPAPHVQDTFAFTVASGKPAMTTKDQFDFSETAGKEEEKAAQKLFANGNYTPITLSAIGVGVLALVMMLGVRMRRGFSPSTVFANTGALGSDMSENMAPGLDDNLLEMKPQGTSSNNMWQPAVFFIDPKTPPRALTAVNAFGSPRPGAVAGPASVDESVIGVRAPAGFWDPLDFSATQPEGFERRRAVERKHGRIACLR